MRLADRDWLVYCRQCGEWTGLHRFLPDQGHFQGEHSLAMNAYLNSDLLLGRFLMHHADHDLIPIPDLSEEFRQIRLRKDRFLERLIDSVVEERMQRDQDRESDLASLRSEGYNVLLALRGVYAQQLQELQHSSESEDEEQKRLRHGQQLGISWCLSQLEGLLDFRRRVT